ncbi:hypothetical protein EIN_183920 [Entamoeba invadens IP1]|uniref:hypothetical protein n=1 Tax=Entamoeba invadens IP1 TaxID=370355 RepID=UPI0002C3E96A|nr:hypothetical protein EIN_183920 [Entamoeba invadens IP1]ELP94075.1 hypothetical protein EIN_183920 [Entamoeba invadens IP1]|eukprot:XP_004260846.1 hypothetical protein EIN_183920 [Entamoeba invadens IP1]
MAIDMNEHQTTLSAFTLKPIYVDETGSLCTIERTEDTKKVNMLKSKRKSANKDSAQQSFLIAILIRNGFYIKIKRLYKRGKTTAQIFVIERIAKEGKTYFDSSKNRDPTVDQKTRRRNADALTNKALMDIAVYYCKTYLEEKKGKSARKSVKMVRFSSAQVDGKDYNLDQIEYIGMITNQLILDIMSRTSSGIELDAYDSRFGSVFSLL